MKNSDIDGTKVNKSLINESLVNDSLVNDSLVNESLVNDSLVNDPPKNLLQKMRWVGPSFIVAAAAIGSGELINATRLGAVASFAVLWVVVWGVVLKGFIQQEIGRYTLTTRKTITEGFADIPGPKFYGKSWFLWIILSLLAVVILLIIAGVGGTIGGVLHSLFPAVSASTWGIIANITYLPILLLGIVVPKINVYSVVEKLMTVAVLGLTLFMLYIAFIALPLSDQYSISMGEVFAGMNFQIPDGALLVSLAVLGSIGAGVELIFYSTWLISKGYLEQAYDDQDSEAKKSERMKTWLGILKLDTWLGVILTLVVSVAFFTTGAVVLNSYTNVPEGVNMIEEISVIFTDVLGPNYYIIFMILALIALFSTALGVADGAARMVIDIRNEISKKAVFKKSANTIYSWAIVIIVLSWIIFYAFVSAPTFLITVGAAALSLLFPLYGLALLYLNRQVPQKHRMSGIVKVILVISFILFTSIWLFSEFV